MGKKELNGQPTNNIEKKEEKINTNVEGKNNQKNKDKYDIVANIHPDDAKDKVFVAIIKALVKNGNTPSTPKELSQYILKHKLTNLGGSTPFATVSSRISQHFKKCSEHKPGHSPRPPLLGKKSFDGMHSRKLYYFIDSPFIKVADIPHPLTKLAAQKAEAKNEKKNVSDIPTNKKKEKIQLKTVNSRGLMKPNISSDNDIIIKNKIKIDKTIKEPEVGFKKDESDSDNEDDEDNESLIKIKEKIQNSKKNSNSELNNIEEKIGKKHGIDSTDSDSTKINKNQKVNNDTLNDENKKLKKIKIENDNMEIESNSTQTKKEIDPAIVQDFDNKPDELIRQLSSDINDIVGVSLISSKPNDLEMELLSDYSSDFSVSTSHAIATEPDSDELDDINNKSWDVPPELMSMNELDSLFSESDLDDFNTMSEDSKSIDSYSTNKRKFDVISTSESDNSSIQESKKINSSIISTFQKKNHIKKASGLSNEIINSFSDNESPIIDDSLTDKKSDNENNTPSRINDDSEKSKDLNSIKEEITNNENIKEINKEIPTKEAEKIEIKTDEIEKSIEKLKKIVTDAKNKNVKEDKPAPQISIEMFYPSSKELIRIFTEAHTNIEYNNYQIKLRKIIHGKLNGDIFFFKKSYNCFSTISEKENNSIDVDNAKDEHHTTNINYKLEKINTDISCSGFVDVSSFFSRKELNDSILQTCHGKMKAKSTEFTWWEQYVNNIIEWSNFINNKLSFAIKIKELLKNAKVEHEDVNIMKKANVIVVCLIKNKTDLLNSTKEPESLLRYKPLNVYSNNISLDTSHQRNNENEERSIIVIQHSDQWNGVWIPNNYFRILVEQLNLSDYLHSFLINKVKNKQNTLKDETKPKDTPISLETTTLDLKLQILNDPNYLSQSFIKYEESEDNTKKPTNKGKSKYAKDSKNNDISSTTKSKSSNKGASSNETKSNIIPKAAPRLPFKLPNFDVTKLTLIHSRPATDPAIWITLIENVKVYMCLIPVNMDILESSDSTMAPPLIPLLRIYNNDMVNGTLLLTAGGVENEQNRSVILSLESKRVRIRKHTNGLCGTWIPLNRARELARTCSLDSKLSVFLSDNLRDYFTYNEGLPTIPLPLTLSNPLLDINKSIAVAALSSLNATTAATTAATTTSTTAATTATTTSSTKASTANGKSKEIPISMKTLNPFQTALNLLSSNHLLLNKGNILGNNSLFSNPSALSLLLKQFPFSPISLPTAGAIPKVSIASNSKKNNNSSQKGQTSKSSTPSTTATTTSTTTIATETTAASVSNAAAIASSLTTTATNFSAIPTLPLNFPSAAATTSSLLTTSTTDTSGFQLAFENPVSRIGKNDKPNSISQLMKTSGKVKKINSIPVRITKKENDVLNSTLASLTNEKFQNSLLSVSPDKNKEYEMDSNNSTNNSHENSGEENDQNLLFLSSSSSEDESNENEDVAFLSRDGYMSETQENRNNKDKENENIDKNGINKDEEDEDEEDEDEEDEDEEDEDEEDEEEDEEDEEENEYDDMEDIEYDEGSESDNSILSSTSDKNIINVVDDDSSDGYKSDYDNNLENMWYLKPRISGGKSKRLNSTEYSDNLEENDSMDDFIPTTTIKEYKKENLLNKKKNTKNTSSRKRKLATDKLSHKKSEFLSRKKKKVINSSSNTKLIIKQSPSFYTSPINKKKKNKTKKLNRKLEIISKSDEEEESEISIISEHSSYIDVNSSDDHDFSETINIMNDDDDDDDDDANDNNDGGEDNDNNKDKDEDFKIDIKPSEIKNGSGKKIIIRKSSNSSTTSSKKVKLSNNSNNSKSSSSTSDKKIKSITIELSNKIGKSTKRQKKNSISKKQSEPLELEDKKDKTDIEPILPLSINIKKKCVTQKLSSTVTSDSQQSSTSSKMVNEVNNSNDSDSSIINIDDSNNLNNDIQVQSSSLQVSSSATKIPTTTTTEEEKIKTSVINNNNLMQNVEPTTKVSTSLATMPVTVTTAPSIPAVKPTKNKKSKSSTTTTTTTATTTTTTTAPPSTENLSPSILKAIKNSQNLALLPEFQAEMKASGKKRSKKQNYNEALNLLNNAFIFPTAVPPPPPPSTTPISKSKLVNIKPKDNQIYPNFNLLNELSLLKKMNKPIILPKFPIPMLPNQGTKPPYNLLDTSSAFPNQFDITTANLSKAAAELLSSSTLSLDNNLASSFAAAAASTSTAMSTTPTSSIDTTASSTLPSTLQSLANNLVFQSIPANVANVIASTLPKPNINQTRIPSLPKKTRSVKNKENVEDDDEEIDIVSDDGFDDFR
ncbi:hypothetical protein BCR36DRAFT_403478 [Piromyces finnis]|uniref:HTH APSES-type domain-containing protein n=1 Tax=Piromyces finnis TaxID=1754191 RepID=A0A1Y1VET1_9FUNG|nr:hypothetical protein BCR36DRAFT_403478 [Piromyces finnis]|eukprot:ORX53820.1 hypothetical protein BCR36DRAFT_403478 [Piromyces finnis]